MVNLSSCDKHTNCVIVFDNVDGCPVCGMIGEIVGILEDTHGNDNEEKLFVIRKKIGQ